MKHVGGGIRRVAFGADLVAVDGSNSQSVELWDLSTESEKPRQKLQPKNHATISALAFTPDGKTLATSYSGGQICLWDATRGSELARFQGDKLGVRALAFAPDGRTLAWTGLRQQGREPLASPHGPSPGRPRQPQRDHHVHGFFSRWRAAWPSETARAASRSSRSGPARLLRPVPRP